jgi:hypothetical protein
VISKGNGNRLIKVWDGTTEPRDIRGVGYCTRQEIYGLRGEQVPGTPLVPISPRPVTESS